MDEKKFNGNSLKSLDILNCTILVLGEIFHNT